MVLLFWLYVLFLKDCMEPAKRRRQEESTGADSETDNVELKTPRDGNKEAEDNEEGLSKVVAEHYNQVKEVGTEARKLSRIYYMRNVNNWIKSMFIEEQLRCVEETKKRHGSLQVLDLCCGKGGDIRKWQHGNISHVIFADIAATSVEQCETRYKAVHNARFTAEFLTADCTRVRLREKFTNVTRELDLVSCQFAFHYCFESLPQAEMMLKNASECLRPGGRFIGTIPNAREIVRRLKENNNKEFGNEVFSVVAHCEPPYTLFGAKYDFKLEEVVDCPEFLVHFPTLVELAKKFGLSLINVRTMPSFFRSKLSEGRGLLYRMQGLETYPADNEEDQAASRECYSHADSYVKDGRKVGTISAPEWDVVSLYLLFVFEKVDKKSYDAKGNPVYNI